MFGLKKNKPVERLYRLELRLRHPDTGEILIDSNFGEDTSIVKLENIVGRIVLKGKIVFYKEDIEGKEWSIPLVLAGHRIVEVKG